MIETTFFDGDYPIMTQRVHASDAQFFAVCGTKPRYEYGMCETGFINMQKELGHAVHKVQHACFLFEA